jgi:hypothetical protein
MSEMSSEELFALSPQEMAELHMKNLSQRYEEMRPRIRVIDRLVTDVEINAIEGLDDIVLLGVPHTTDDVVLGNAYRAGALSTS